MSNWFLLLVLAGLSVDGCTHIGPGTVPRDRFDYNQAIADSWKEQTLLNVVKLRYADLPLFLEVSSIVSGYTLEGSVNAAGTVFERPGPNLSNFLSLGAASKYTDRPTITYAPITGSKFNQNFMTPAPPSAILFLIQAGWPASIVLPLTVEAINGLRAQKSVGAGQRAGSADYYRVIELFSLLRRSGAMGMRVVKKEKEEEGAVMVIRRSNLPPEVIAAREELTKLLGIRLDAGEYRVVFAEVPQDDRELAMLTRSILSIMVELAGQIEVPEEHVTAGRTVPSLMIESGTAEKDGRRLITIHQASEKPGDAFTAVRYKDRWFWINDRDFNSKRTFAYLMLLFSLTETGGKEGLPLVTIPAG